MLYTGNNIGTVPPTSFDENGKAVKSEKVKEIENSINIFDEKKSIVRQGLHYTGLCADLSHENKSGQIDYLSGTVQRGMNRLAGLNVDKKNTDFLQDTVGNLVNNFREAATTARRRAEERAERSQAERSRAISSQGQDNKREIPASNHQAEIAAQDVTQTLDSAIANVNESNYNKKDDKKINIFENKGNENGNDKTDKTADVGKPENTPDTTNTQDTTKITETAKANDAVKATDVATTTEVPKVDTNTTTQKPVLDAVA